MLPYHSLFLTLISQSTVWICRFNFFFLFLLKNHYHTLTLLAFSFPILLTVLNSYISFCECFSFFAKKPVSSVNRTILISYFVSSVVFFYVLLLYFTSSLLFHCVPLSCFFPVWSFILFHRSLSAVYQIFCLSSLYSLQWLISS